MTQRAYRDTLGIIYCAETEYALHFLLLLLMIVLYKSGQHVFIHFEPDVKNRERDCADS